jgi:hypothetical protein
VLADRRLATEERKLTSLEDQRAAVVQQRPKVLPHPTAGARYVTDLAAVVEAGDVAEAGRALRQALSPFKMVPTGTGYRLRGELDLSEVCDKDGSGGALPFPS